MAALAAACGKTGSQIHARSADETSRHPTMNPSISLHPHLLALHVQATLPESNRERLLALVVVVGALPPNQPPG